MLSIIIPVYNSIKYLNRCIESVLAQKYRNIEIILVDDGSTDNSGILCEAYAMLDSRIHVFHKENGGPVSAKKYGVLHSNGDFIGYVDSDDYIDQDYYERLVNAQKSSGADIVCCGYKNIVGGRQGDCIL